RGDHGSLDDFREAALHPRRARRGRARRGVVAPCRKVVPMTFRFRKLYADVVSDDGTVTIVYLTWLELWGARFASAGVERYGSDGGREVQHARPQAWQVNPDSVGDGWGVRLELPSGDLELRYQSARSSWGPGGGPDVEPSRAVAGTRVTAAGRRGGAGRRARADPCPTRRTGARPRALSCGSDAVRGACADGRAA